MGSVLDVYSLEELQRIKKHLSENEIENQEQSILLNRRLGTSDAVLPVTVVSVDALNLASLDDLGPSSITEFEGAGITIGNPPGQIGVIDNTNVLYIRGVENNDYVVQGIINGVPSGEVITGLETLSGPNGTLYGISTNGVNSSHLLQVDLANTTASPIGGNNGLILPIALGRDGSDNLITIDIDDDMVYAIDIVTGAASIIGPLGYDANFGQGMVWDDNSSQLLNAAYNQALGDSELRLINTTTGASSVLGTIDPGNVSQYGYLTAYDRDILDVPSIEENIFSFYPNPVQEELVFTASTEVTQLTIYNVTGQKVLETFPAVLQGELQINSLAAGYYVLKVTMQGTTQSFKFVKQ
ncbi:T9SS type A sorting domain-containing protein [Altibacter sp.]|uniref:T9SS type A sorting domain-containing protein n=1 Tax=Altibacter sp. TaxID=2024823 RepID=UPI00258BD463|nr:T9SS type A sorting domain-containing protein [Altibacter sp.]MCW9038662.1 T9SS type A sorting domain-containing protein [Altibacter sp.]